MTTTRDRRIAEDAAIDRTLLCIAQGCPSRWSVDAGNGRCCSAHAWADRHSWPRITQELQDAETDRARYGAAARPEPIEVPYTLAEKRAILLRLRNALADMQRDPRGWATRP